MPSHGGHDTTFPLHTVRLRHRVLGRTVSNEFHVGELIPGYVEAQDINLARIFQAWWEGIPGVGDGAADLCGNNVRDSAVEMWLRRAGSEVPVLNLVLDLADSLFRPSECTSNEQSVAVEWTTGHAGRSQHGRTFLVAVPDDAFRTDNRDRIKDEYAADVVRIYGHLLDYIAGFAGEPAGMALAIKHRVPITSLVGPSASWSPITGVQLYNLRAASQRARRPRRIGPSVVWSSGSP